MINKYLFVESGNAEKKQKVSLTDDHHEKPRVYTSGTASNSGSLLLRRLQSRIPDIMTDVQNMSSTSLKAHSSRSPTISTFADINISQARRSFPDILGYVPPNEAQGSFNAAFAPESNLSDLQNSGHLSRRSSQAPSTDSLNRSFLPAYKSSRQQSPVLGDDKGAESSLETVIESLRCGSAPQSIVIGIKLSGWTSQSFFNALADSKTTQALSFGPNTLDSKTCQLLAQALEKTLTLSILRLGSNGVSDDAFNSILGAVSNNPILRIKELYIAHNKAGLLAAKEISKGLQGVGGLKFLTVLNISHSAIEDKGGAVIADALCRNNRLRKLDMGSNNLSELSGAALTRCLRTNTTLQELRIERNPFLESRCMQDLVDSILSNEDCGLLVLYSSGFPPCIYRLARSHIGYTSSGGSADFRKAMEICSQLRDWLSLSKVLTQTVWSKITNLKSKKDKSLIRHSLLGWADRANLKAVSKISLKWLHARVKQHYNDAWKLRMEKKRITQAEREASILLRTESSQKVSLLVTILAWRLRGKPKTWSCSYLTYPWWRIRLTNTSIQACVSRWGKDKYVHYFRTWERFHYRWYFCCLRTRQSCRTLVWMSFLGWFGQCSSRPVFAAQSTKRYHKIHSLRLEKCFGTWRRRTSRRKIAKTAVRRWKHAFVRAGWRMWKDQRQRNVKLEAVHRQIASRWAESDIKAYFNLWAHGVEASVREKQILSRSQGKLSLRIVSAWYMVLLAERKYKNGQTNVPLRCRSYWRCWKDSFLQSRVINLKIKTALNFWIGKFSLVVLTRWLTRAKYSSFLHACEAKIHKRRNGIVSARCIIGFYANSARKVSRRDILSEMTLKRLAQTKDKSLTCWQANAAYSRTIKKKIGYLLFAHGKRVLLETIHVWRDNIRYLQHLKQKIKKALSNQETRLESGFFTKWISLIREQRGQKRRIRHRCKSHQTRFMKQLFKYWIEIQRSTLLCQLGVIKAALMPWNAMHSFAKKLEARTALDQWNEGILQRRSLINSNKQNWLQRTRSCFLQRCKAQEHQMLAIRAFSGWKLCGAMSMNVIQGREAYKGIMPQQHFNRYILSRPLVNVEKLVEVMQLEKGGIPTHFMQEILHDWDSQQRQGSLSHKLELYRFLCFLFGEWNPLLVEEVNIDASNVLPGWATPTVQHVEDNRVSLDLPYVSTREILESKLHRAMNMTLPSSFSSRLPTGCGMLEEARRFCLQIGIAPSYLDVAGDHEPWVDGSRVKMVGIPPQRYVAPIGWVRIGVKVDDALVGDQDIWEKWNVTFHGTKKDMLPRIISSRALLPPGSTDSNGRIVKNHSSHFGALSANPKFALVTENARSEIVEVRSGVARGKEKVPARKSESFDPSKFTFTTPSIKYASQPYHAVPFVWNRKRVQVVLQLRQSTRHVKVVQPPYIGPSIIPFDDCYSNDELGWFTCAQGTIAVTGILFRYLEGEDE